MTLRDDLLPVFNAGRKIVDDFGLRRVSVVIRRRTWSGGVPGSGTASNSDTTLSPRPRVRQVKAEEVAGSGGTYEQGDIRIDRITPSHTGGGYTPAQLELKTANGGEEVLIVLTGDEGAAECTLVSESYERAFGYTLVVRRTGRNP